MLTEIFPGESELAGRMRALDWSKTDLGPPAQWPQNLRIAVSLCLTSRLPVVVYWGPNHTVLYNDAYISFLGPSKHPRSLGRPGQECWNEIWDTIGPMLEGVRYSGRATWSNDMQMFFSRAVKLEEVFVRFTFGPILGQDGRTVEGIFCPCTETTEQVVGARRLETLRRLGVRPSGSRTIESACRAAAEPLSENRHDIPFAAIYAVDEGEERAHRLATTGLGDAIDLLPASVDLTDPHATAWPFAVVARTMHAAEARDLDLLETPFPSGPYPEPARRALVLPITATARHRLSALLVVGVSPRLLLDESYRTFLDLVAGHIGTVIAEARAFEEADRRKEEFLATLSQELRGPLAPLGNMLEVLKRSSGDGEVVRQAQGTMERQLTQLVRVVDDLLDVGRIARNRLELRCTRVELGGVLRRAVEGSRRLAESLGHDLSVTAPDVPIEVDGDPMRLEQVFDNLVHNACRYTGPNGRIAVSLAREGGEAVVRVLDDGVGIPRDKLASVFEMFTQVDPAIPRSEGGLGIGLTLVKRLTELHGGRVEAMSEGPGRGSEFTVRLPALPPQAASPAPEPQAAKSTPASRRILVVDDNPDSLTSLSMLLRLSGNETHTAQDGLEAVKAAEWFHPDVVLMDLGLPKLSGVDAARKIREQSWGKAMLIVALTGWGQDEDKRKSQDAGFDAHMVKPVNHDALMEVLATMKESA